MGWAQKVSVTFNEQSEYQINDTNKVCLVIRTGKEVIFNIQGVKLSTVKDILSSYMFTTQVHSYIGASAIKGSLNGAFNDILLETPSTFEIYTFN